MKTGSGAPAHSSTRTVDALGQLAEQIAQPARRRSSRVSPKSGVTCQPAIWTCERAASTLRDRAERLLAVDEHL